MASTYALRCEAHLIVLRGVMAIRAIEIMRQVEDGTLLAARMEHAATDGADDFDDGEWAPTAAEIAAARDEINATWTDEEREGRWRYRFATIEKARARGATHYQRHAEGIRAEMWERRQAPDFRARTREYNRRYRERHAAAFKERQAARRDKVNAQRQKRRAENHEAFLESTRAYRASRREILNEQSRGYKAARRAEARAAAVA